MIGRHKAWEAPLVSPLRGFFCSCGARLQTGSCSSAMTPCGAAMIDEKTREELNACLPTFSVSEDEADNFYACPSCGQLVDMRRLGDVLHHEEEGHKPLPVNDP